MVKLSINDKIVEVDSGITVLQACEEVGIEIPRFCYHEKLSIAGNCRMCLVEMENSVKPVASCAMPVADGMKISTNSKKVEKARKGVMEFLLINHPLDCPICDQGGECDLQDQAMAYGQGISRFVENKRAVKDKNLGPLIKTHMTRCIHCTRCVRFSEEVAGNEQFGSIGRGEDTEITSYLEKSIDSELSGNVIDLCPVGALTSKPYAFVARPWELKKTNSIDVFDAVGSNIRIDSKGDKIMRVLPRINEEINEEWISDKTRFAYDGINYQRIDRYYSRTADNKLVEDTEDNVVNTVFSKFKMIKPSKIGALVGNSLDCESIFSFKNFLDSLDVSSYDCRQDNSFFLSNQRSSYIFNSSIAGIDESDFCILVGTDIKKEAPILSSRIRQRYNRYNDNYQVLRVGETYKTNFPVQNLGSKPEDLKQILTKKDSFFKKYKKPMIIVGQGALCRNDSESIFSLCQSIYSKFSPSAGWNGLNILQTYSGRVGALDLNFYNKRNVNKINLIEKIYSGQFEVLYLLCADEIEMEKIPKKTFVIYQGHHGDESVKRADLVIPTSCFTEKEGIYVNLEGRPQIARQVKMPLPEIRHSYEFLNLLLKKLKIEVKFQNINSIRQAMFDIHPHLSKINQIFKEKKVLSKCMLNKLDNSLIKSNIRNFYKTDSVSRVSPTMASCSQNFYDQSNAT